MFSVTSQTNAVGQVVGGPVVGAIGNRSVRAALLACAMLLSPVVGLYAVVARRSKREESKLQLSIIESE